MMAAHNTILSRKKYAIAKLRAGPARAQMRLILAETRTLWNEKLDGFSVTKFDGTATTV